MRAWLEEDDGTRLPLSGRGLVLGRDPGSERVLADPAASRRHALVYSTSAGAQVVPLGRNPTTVNGSAITAATELADGDRLGVPGVVLGVRIAAAPAIAWALERAGTVYGIRHSPFVVGPDGDLALAGDASVTLHHVQGGLVVEGSGAVDGARLAVDEVRRIDHGATLVVGDHTLAVLALAGGAATTAVAGPSAPTFVRLEFLPRGGRLLVGHGTAETSVWLADRRCDLVAALLQPPAPHRAGDLVPDAALTPKIWPGRETDARVDLNTLIYRTRKGLVRAGLDGTALLQRAKGGGATRFVVAPGARVEVT